MEFIFIEFKLYIESIWNSNSIEKKRDTNRCTKYYKYCSFITFIIHDYDVEKTQIWKETLLYSIQSKFQFKIYFGLKKKQLSIPVKAHSKLESIFDTKIKYLSIPFKANSRENSRSKIDFGKLVDPITVHPTPVAAPTETLSLEFASLPAFLYSGNSVPWALSLSRARARAIALQELRARQLLLHAGVLWRRSAALVSLITWLIVAIMVHAYPFFRSFFFSFLKIENISLVCLSYGLFGFTSYGLSPLLSYARDSVALSAWCKAIQGCCVFLFLV